VDGVLAQEFSLHDLVAAVKLHQPEDAGKQASYATKDETGAYRMPVCHVNLTPLV
jgi:hypothetical protein